MPIKHIKNKKNNKKTKKPIRWKLIRPGCTGLINTSTSETGVRGHNLSIPWVCPHPGKLIHTPWNKENYTLTYFANISSPATEKLWTVLSSLAWNVPKAFHSFVGYLKHMEISAVIKKEKKFVKSQQLNTREILLPEQEPLFHVTHVMFPSYFCSIFSVTWYFSWLAQNRSRDNRGSGSGLAESPYRISILSNGILALQAKVDWILILCQHWHWKHVTNIGPITKHEQNLKSPLTEGCKCYFVLDSACDEDNMWPMTLKSDWP